MDLDDLPTFAQIDSQDMLAHIEGLPDQLQSAWQLGNRLVLPDWGGIERVVIAGMGGSAIGGDLLATYTLSTCHVPVILHRNYELPAWAKEEQTLVIASSHSGNTEETLTAFDRARSNGCRLLTLTSGGKLAQASRANGVPVWQFEHSGQPRAAVGYSFGLLLAAFYRLGLIPDPEGELKEAIQAMRVQQKILTPSVPVVNNPAKRMAGQLIGRWVTVIGADLLEPVARRWKAQLNEIAKTWGQYEALPEFDHNTLAGVANPEEVLEQSMVLFLRAPSCHPANQLRTNLTKKALMLEGLNTDFIDAQGSQPLAHQWTALHFGDYTAYYLAMAYGVDPTLIPAIDGLKRDMGMND